VSRHGAMMDFLFERLAIKALELTARIEELKKAGMASEEMVIALRKIKLEAMEEVRRILTISLGAPPKEFEWATNGTFAKVKDAPKGDLRGIAPTTTFKGTPLEFYQAVVKGPGLDPLKDFAVISASPFLNEGELYAVKKDKFAKDSTAGSEYEQKTLNVSVNDLEALTEKSIAMGMPLWFAADVGRDVAQNLRVMDPNLFNYEAVYQIPEKNWPSETEKRRALTYSRVVSPNHAMVIDGLYKAGPEAPVERWRVENSWGSPQGTGNRPTPWHMTARWYRENVYQIVVHKGALSPALWKKWTESRPTVIKKEGWMFGPEPQ
jgi:bleomycin hydrolase